MNRRQFINRSTTASLAATAPLILPSHLFGATAPSKQITLGCIGLGPQGVGTNMAAFLTLPNARVVAVCDCKLSKTHEAKTIVDEAYGNQDCKVYQDFREIIDRKDIDAVVISTPDHWHAPMSMMALRAGKDVFCEKPSLTMTEGRVLVEEAAKRQKVFQWGIEDRSLIKYWMLAGLARTGAIGKVHSVECGLPRKPLFDIENPAAIPDDLDWNLWLGPARFAEHTPSVTNNQRWRQRVDYSGGSLTDWGSHLCDTAQIGIGMDDSGPAEILGTSTQLPEKSYVTTPSGYDILYRYSNNSTIRVRDTARKIFIRFEGRQGWIQCEKFNGELSASDMNLFRNKEFGEHPNFWPRPEREQKEFINAVISRGPTTYHPEAGHRLSSMLHLGHIAIRSGKTIHWDPKKEQFAKDAEEHQTSIIYRREARDWEKES
jgi:predicted dehydrogenase